ncbi:MAG: GPR endopeptidase [Bacilli bacterium]|nr:GPR endopeptidase [Bacilli bacterium]
MKNRINLNNYSVRTDLIIENGFLASENLEVNNINDNIKVTNVIVDDKLSLSLNKRKGNYTTIEFIDITNHEDKIEIKKILEKEIKVLLNKLHITSNNKVLIIGLGNKNSTADSLGPKVIDKILVTRHLFELGTNIKKGIRNVSAISPGVMATTGIETYDTITSLVNKIKPDFLIVIDSLASLSIDRINKTIQLTDTGIHPGSGVGNNRKELSIDTIGIPVIAIGVPTVVESSTIVNDTINYLFKHLSYIKNNYQVNKLVFNHSSNYLKDIKDMDLTSDEKKEVSGILGELDEETKKQFINEVLTSLNYNLIVTPKEIDYLVDNLSETISGAINNSLHKDVNNL